MTLAGTLTWWDTSPTHSVVIKNLAKYLNSTVHTTTGMKPKDVRPEHIKELARKLNAKNYMKVKKDSLHLPKFKVGQHVRVVRHRRMFEKDAENLNWSSQLFRIYSIHNSSTNVPYYRLVDLKGKPVSGSFVTDEVKSVRNNDLYLTSKTENFPNNQSLVTFLNMPPEYAQVWTKTDELS